MILGIGVDLLHVARLRAVMSRRGSDRLAARILSAGERREWQRYRRDPAWAALQQERYLSLR